MGGASTEVSDDEPRHPARGAPGGTRAASGGRGAPSASAPRRATGSSAASICWGGARRMRRCIELILRDRGRHAGRGAGRSLARAHQPAADLPPAGAGGPGARRRAALARARAAPGRHRRHGREQAGRRPHRGGRARAGGPTCVREIDLIEEIARLHGYDSFPSDLRPLPGRARCPTRPRRRSSARVRRGLVGRGLLRGRQPADGPGRRAGQRAPAQSARGRRRLAPAPAAAGPGAAGRGQLGQPCAPTCACSRSAPRSRPAPPGERPREERRVAAVLTGRREPAHWTGGGEARFDIWDLKGRLEAAVALAIPGAEVQVEGQAWVVRDRAGPGRRRGRAAGGRRAALGRAALRVRAARRSRRPAVRPPSRRCPRHRRPSACSRCSCRRACGCGRWRRCSAGPAATLLERVDVESDYRGRRAAGGHAERGVPADFRAPDRTLRDSEVDEAETRLLAALAARAGHRATGRRVPHRRVTVAYTYERPDLPALAELERGPQAWPRSWPPGAAAASRPRPSCRRRRRAAAWCAGPSSRNPASG